MKKKNLDKMKENFQLYLISLEDSLIDLERFLAQCVGKEYKLDYTLDSLVLVEFFFDKVLDGEIQLDVPLDMLMTRISTYMGEIVRKQRKGDWELCVDENDHDFGYPQLGGMDGFIKEFAWCPLNVVYNYESNRKKELLKNACKYIIEYEYA